MCIRSDCCPGSGNSSRLSFQGRSIGPPFKSELVVACSPIGVQFQSREDHMSRFVTWTLGAAMMVAGSAATAEPAPTPSETKLVELLVQPESWFIEQLGGKRVTVDGQTDRKSLGQGKRVPVRVHLGGRRFLIKKL